MLTPKYLKNLPNGLGKYYQNLEDKILIDITKRLNKSLELTGTSRARIEALLNMGYDLKKIKSEIKDDLDMTAHKLGHLVNKAGLKSFAEDAKFYNEGGKKLKENPAVLKMIETMRKSSIEDLNNLTGTIGLAGKPLEKWYKDKLNQGIIDITSGAYSRTEVMRSIVKEVSSKGLEYIQYQSGRNFSVEAAVKMNLVTSVNRLSAEISLENAKEMKQDLMEITAHAGARPTHQEWQGQIVSLSGRDGYLTLNDIGYGSAEGFMGVNCRHNWYPYFEGMSKRFWDEDSLEAFKYKGKKYDEHSAYQRVRNLERTYRKHDRQSKMFKAIGDKDAALIEDVKKQRLVQEEKKFKKVIKNNSETRYNIYRDIESADKFHRPQTIEYWKEWTKDEKKALYGYTRSSTNFNGPLRENGKITERIQMMKSALDKTSLKENVTVFRGVDDYGFKQLLNLPDTSLEEILKNKENVIGKIVYDNAFVSTGVNPGGGFTRDISYEIRCPKGTKGAYVEPFSYYGRSKDKLNWDGVSFADKISQTGENEFIIQAKTQMKVLDMFMKKDTLKVILEVVL